MANFVTALTEIKVLCNYLASAQLANQSDKAVYAAERLGLYIDKLEAALPDLYRVLDNAIFDAIVYCDPALASETADYLELIIQESWRAQLAEYR